MDEIKKHHRKLALLAISAVMFLILVAGASGSSPLTSQLPEHLQSGTPLSDPTSVGTTGESSNFLQHCVVISFSPPVFLQQVKPANSFFHISGKKTEILASVSPRGPPGIS